MDDTANGEKNAQKLTAIKKYPKPLVKAAVSSNRCAITVWAMLAKPKITNGAKKAIAAHTILRFRCWDSLRNIRVEAMSQNGIPKRKKNV